MRGIYKILIIARYSGDVRKNHRYEGGVKMTMITAHSGSDNTEENSWEFIRFCLDKEISFEVDVHKREDGTLVLAHDKNDVTQASVALADVFKELALEKKKLTINCDLKEESLEMNIFSLAQTYQIWPQVVMSGFVRLSWASIWEEHIFYNIENQFSSNEIATITEEDLIKQLQELAYQNVKIVNIHEGWLTSLIREVGGQLGLGFSVWTVNEKETIDYFVACNVYNVTSRCAWAYQQAVKGEKNVEILESQATVS